MYMKQPNSSIIQRKIKFTTFLFVYQVYQFDETYDLSIMEPSEALSNLLIKLNNSSIKQFHSK